MKRNYDIGLLVLRIGMAALMLTHGIPKFMAFIGGDLSVVGDPLGIGGMLTSILVLLGELVAPVLIIIGIKTRFAAVASAITMAVAAFVVHGADPLAKKEMALLYLIGFLSIALMGAGSISVDKK
ncbi:MAG TPA: DoxX family protein [Flavobacteriaceae bacterium]|jgi:putative oxidoreductase|nr:DoxX family protein [Flavobacteriaceae bacterium]MAM29248.1 DoxX family protein [Flavobacteriaceae bacterium]MAY53403.1 DoxX family protein [Flavobacteriaceae bacterium]HBR52715.1 DoxX family protein [Flavobacteriaceae bacterium]HIB48223.1 DoxX family protein [Flavobacteriaceae bacterium]|tara:strand:+ start:655 stop:1029 length:375 start_codon:yes stop_codon:yes gene_type:complete